MSKYALIEFNGMFRADPGMTGNGWNKFGSRRLATFSTSKAAHAALADVRRGTLLAVCKKGRCGWYTVTTVIDNREELGV